MSSLKLSILVSALFATVAFAAPDEVRRDRSTIAPCGSEACNARYATFGAAAQPGESAYRRAMHVWRFEGASAAVAPLEQAVALGSPPAMYHLGGMYIRGEAVARDEARGLDLVRQAAERGDPAAMLALASAFRHGDGVARDEGLARLWLSRAADAGYRPAMEARRRLASP